MSELIDKFMIRMILAILLCAFILLFRYVYDFIYSASNSRALKNFDAAKNPAHTIHLFSKILGLGIIFSEYHFYIYPNVLMTLIDFFLFSFTTLSLYLLSLTIFESIMLHDFEFHDEVIKRKNYSYSIISFAHAFASASILKTILVVSGHSLITLIFLWLFAMVLLGLSLKIFSSKINRNFNRLLVQKNLSIAFYYTGFLIGIVLILQNAFFEKISSDSIGQIKWYILDLILKLTLSIIFVPFFRFLFMWIFHMKLFSEQKEDSFSNLNPEIGHGISEGVLFLVSCYLSTVVTGKVHFEIIAPMLQ